MLSSLLLLSFHFLPLLPSIMSKCTSIMFVSLYLDLILRSVEAARKSNVSSPSLHSAHLFIPLLTDPAFRKQTPSSHRLFPLLLCQKRTICRSGGANFCRRPPSASSALPSVRPSVRRVLLLLQQGGLRRRRRRRRGKEEGSAFWFWSQTRQQRHRSAGP